MYNIFHQICCIRVLFQNCGPDFDNDDKLGAIDLREVILRLTTSVVEGSTKSSEPQVERLEDRDVNKLVEKVASLWNPLAIKNTAPPDQRFPVRCYTVLNR